MVAIHCTPEAPWWQAFPVYRTLQGRRVVFRWDRPEAAPERIYTSPLLEAKRYASLLRHDPFVKTQTDLAKEMGVSRVRICQVMSLLRLEDQRAVRFFSERRLRPLAQIEDSARQLEEFQKLLAQV